MDCSCDRCWEGTVCLSVLCKCLLNFRQGYRGNKQLIFLYICTFQVFFIHIFSEINNISIQKAMFRTVFLNNNVSYLQFPCARLKFSFSFKGVSPKFT